MTFLSLALIAVIALAGPLLALPARWHLPVMLGELLAGIAIGRSGLALVDPADPTFTLLANIGFALMMFVAGTHVPVRDPQIRAALGKGSRRAMAAAAAAVVVGTGIGLLFGTGHAPLYVVLLASSSAALVLPIVDSLRLGGPDVVAMTAQVAIADTACIVALPLLVDPPHAGQAALGVLVVTGCAVVLFVGLRWLERQGIRRRVHRLSESRKFALELRIQLAVLFALAGVATWSNVSVMMAGFSFGLVMAAVGEPRRLARQLFALSDGFLGPLFFVWLGASLTLKDLAGHPDMMALGLVLGAGALLTHADLAFPGTPAAARGVVGGPAWRAGGGGEHRHAASGPAPRRGRGPAGGSACHHSRERRRRVTGGEDFRAARQMPAASPAMPAAPSGRAIRAGPTA